MKCDRLISGHCHKRFGLIHYGVRLVVEMTINAKTCLIA